MNIEVRDLTSVDKEVVLTAPLSEINEEVEKKIREYRKQVQMPGFRPGKVPMAMVRKRLQKDVEQEEAAKFIQKAFEKDIVSEHKPVGESQLNEFDVTDEEIKATFKIGVRPEFELTDVSELVIDKMVHDVTDEEVDEEFAKSLDRAASFEVTDKAAETGMKAKVDIVAFDDAGEVNDAETERNQDFDLSDNPDNDDDLKPFRDAVIGKKAGEFADLELDGLKYRIDVKEVKAKKEVEANEDFFKGQTGGEATDEATYKSWLKSKMQEYYDQQAVQNMNSSIVEALIEKHPLEVPEVLMDTMANNYLQNLSQQMGGKLPEGFGLEQIKNTSKDQLLRDGRWFFLSEKLEEKHAEEVEIKPEDIDSFLAEEAAKYGMTADQLKSMYAQNTQQLENLRGTIRERKLFKLLADQVQENELSKEEFNKKLEEKKKADSGE